MKNANQNMKSLKHSLAGTSASILAGSIVAVLGLIAQPTAHANGMPYYFDVDDSTAGFGAPSGSYDMNASALWSTDSTGSAATAALAPTMDPGAQWTFGAIGSDFAGATFTINANGAADWFRNGGIVINSTSAHITLSGANTLNSNGLGATTWSVATGSSLTVDGNYGGIGGLNWGGEGVIFTGGGTFIFETCLGLNAGNSTLTQTGAVVTLKSAVPAGTQSWDTMAKYTLTGGTMNLATAQASGAFNLYGNDNGALTINGGIIDNTSGSAMTLDLKGDYAGQGVINIGGNFTFTGSSSLSFGTTPVALTASSQITVAANTLTVGRGISGGGAGLAKAGTGTLVLAGANSYTGATTVSSGTLYLNNTNATRAISVAGGATLGGRGSASAATATVDATGIVEAGFGGTGELTLAGLTFSDTATVKFGNIGNYSSSAAIHVTTTDGLIASGAAGSVTLALSGAAPSISGTAHLLHYDGTFGGTGFGAFILNTAAVTFGLRPVSFTLTNPEGYVDVDYVADQPVWSGAGDGEWVTSANLTITPTTDWVLSSNALTQTNFIVGDTPIFNDAATPLVTVEVGINAGNVSPSAVLFSNNTKNYLLSGGDGIAGGATLTKSGTGNVTIGTPNSYTGGTTVTAGSLILSGSGTLGATTGTLTVDGAAAIVDLGATSQTVGMVILRNGAAITNGTLTGTSFAVEAGMIGADLAGSGVALTKTTGDTVVLSGFNTYTGATVINAGTLSLTGTLGASGGTAVSVNGTAILDQSSTGSIAGSSSLTVNSGTATLAGVNSYSGQTTINGGTLTLAHNLAVTTSTLKVGTGGTVAFATGITSPSIGGLTGAGNIALTTESAEDVALTVGGNGQSTIYSGTLSGGNGLTKAGGGTLTMTGAQAYGGPTVVNAGTLKLMGQNAVQLITNGSFETGTPPANGSHEAVSNSNVSGWTTGGSNGVVWYMTSSNWGGGGPAGGGNFLVNLNGNTTIFQSFAVTAGTNYLVSYDEERRGGGGCMDTRLSLGAGTFISYGGGTPSNVSSPSATTLLQTTAVNADWTRYSFSFRPDTTTLATLVFANAYIAGVSGDNDGVFLDKVSVTSTVQTPNLLPMSTPVSIGDNATLDLNATNQKIASLADVAGLTPTGHRVLIGGGKLIIGDPTNAASPADSTFTGEISGAGASEVEKVGTTTVQTLNGAQRYNTLTVSGGTLNVNGELGTTPVNGTASVVVADSANLKFGDVSQTLSSLTIGAGATVTFTSGVASGAFSGGGGKDLSLGNAAVPEPGTLGLLLTGALGVLNRRRRQG
ncbi:MAG: autotransporter-associated beta strand repeat-containing protein [Verrucomicrobiota bacterium]